jgi:hypothetical protein
MTSGLLCLDCSFDRVTPAFSKSQLFDMDRWSSAVKPGCEIAETDYTDFFGFLVKVELGMWDD